MGDLSFAAKVLLAAGWLPGVPGRPSGRNRHDDTPTESYSPLGWTEE